MKRITASLCVAVAAVVVVVAVVVAALLLLLLLLLPRRIHIYASARKRDLVAISLSLALIKCTFVPQLTASGLFCPLLLHFHDPLPLPLAFPLFLVSVL